MIIFFGSLEKLLHCVDSLKISNDIFSINIFPIASSPLTNLMQFLFSLSFICDSSGISHFTLHLHFLWPSLFSQMTGFLNDVNVIYSSHILCSTVSSSFLARSTKNKT